MFNHSQPFIISHLNMSHFPLNDRLLQPVVNSVL